MTGRPVQIEPGGNSLTAKQQHAEENRIKRKSGEGLGYEQRPLDRARHAGQFAPIGAELECHDDSGDNAESESRTEDFEPKLEQEAVGRAPCSEMKGFQHGEPSCQSDRERREYDVKRYGERELQPREKESRDVHERRASPP